MLIESATATSIAALTAGDGETRALGAKLAAELSGGEVLGLRGDLGAGKTVFVQGLACGLGACEPVTSPSFVLVHQYCGRLLLCHVDLYRLDPEQVTFLGLEDLMAPDTVVAIEWAERLPDHLRRRLSLDISLDFRAGESEREVCISALTPPAVEGLARLANALGNAHPRRNGGSR